MADDDKKPKGLKRVEEAVRRMLSGVGSARSSETAPRQLQLDKDMAIAMGKDPEEEKKKKAERAKKKVKKTKKKKKKWYSK